MSNTSKKLVIFILLLTFIVAGAAVYISIELNKQEDVGPTVTPAASEEITSAEMANFDTTWDWTAYNSNWQKLTADNTKGWEDYVNYALGEGARYKCDEEILTVGAEKLYGCDLNALFVLYDFEKYVEPNTISPQDSRLNAVLDGLLTNSALLQEAEKQKLFELDPSFYNSTSKDTFIRFEMVDKARIAFGDLFERTVDFEVVALYFHNEREARVKPISAAKAVAQKKMDVLYERLKAGTITMEQAGQEIINDKIEGDDSKVSNESLDELYKENAYMNVEKHKFNSQIFKDPVYDDELRSLGEGQMSTVRLCKDYDFDSLEKLIEEKTENIPMVESCFIIFKVNKINYGLLDSKDEDAKDYEQVLYNTYKQETENTTGNYFVNLFMSTLKVNAANGLIPHVQHRFKIKLPDGSMHELKGAKIHQLRKEVDTTKQKCTNDWTCDDENSCAEGRDCNCRWEDSCRSVPDTYKAVASSYCRYPATGASTAGIDMRNMANYDCYTLDSCFASTYYAPYLPLSYNSTQAIDNDPDASSQKFYNQTFKQRFPMFNNVYDENNMRKIPNAVWQAQLDYTMGGSASILQNHNNDFMSNLKQENGGWGTVTGYAGKQTWKGGEVVYDTAGGNVLHSLITWTLVVSKLPSPPRCVGFNIYDNTNDFPNVIAGSQTAPVNKALTDTITVRAASADPDGLRMNMICWSASGLAKADYYWRKNWICAALCGPDAASSPEKGVCDDQVAYRGHVTNTIQGFIDKIPDAATKEKAKTNGLVFVHNVYEAQPGGFCSTSPGYSESGAYFPPGSTTTDGQPYTNPDTASRCGVADGGSNCVRRVQLKSEPLQCLGYNVYKEDGTLLSTPADGSAQISLNIDKAQKFYVAGAATDPAGSLVGKRMNICWSVAGQAEAFYRLGLGSYVCETFTAGAGATANAGRVQTPARTFQEFVDMMLDDAKNPQTQKLEAASKEIIRTQVNAKGLVIVYNFYDLTQTYFCSSNVGWANGEGVLLGGQYTTPTVDPNKCSVTPQGRICKALVKLQEVVVQEPKCGDNLCNKQGENCDGTLACKGTGLTSSFVCRAPGTAAECTYCGDGEINGGEECDDANLINTDGCNTSCLKPNKCDEPCVNDIGCGGGLTCQNGVCDGTICEQPPECGDNKCDTGEACDGNLKCIGNGDLSAGECRVGGSNECTYCGDGIVQTAAGEQCDDGNTNNSDSCDNSCKLPAQARCGDGKCDSGEGCEGTKSCITNQSLSAGQVCRLDCTYCGDRMVQAGEQCDEGSDTANCTASCVRKTIITPIPPTPVITGISTYTPTPIPTLVPTDLDADEIWMYTMGMGLIGLGLVAYRLNLGYKFAGVVMSNGGLELLLKIRNTKKHMQRKGLLRRSRNDFEKDFVEGDD
ncbi:DUF4215 domain-containing protein [Candidatus Dojkabacteria bacterium]|nr:DUF4215 domain-containing protein [Candidatus Dojkabacteria bacterium]